MDVLGCRHPVGSTGISSKPKRAGDLSPQFPSHREGPQDHSKVGPSIRMSKVHNEKTILRYLKISKHLCFPPLHLHRYSFLHQLKTTSQTSTAAQCSALVPHGPRTSGREASVEPTTALMALHGAPNKNEAKKKGPKGTPEAWAMADGGLC